MKNLIRITLGVFAFLMVVPESDGVYGTRRRTRRRTAVVVGTTSSAHAAQQQQAAAAQQPAAPAEQPAAPAEQPAAPAEQPAAPAEQPAAVAPPAATSPSSGAPGKKIPEGTVVATLPAGAVATPVNGVQYYYGGGNFYRAVFQGNQLVYVTADPK